MIERPSVARPLLGRPAEHGSAEVEGGRELAPLEHPLKTSLEHFAALVLAVIAVVLPLAACGGDDDDASSSAPANTDGEGLYAANCASCHGADLRGTDKGPSHLSIVYEPNHHPDDAFRSAIANGVPAHHWGFGNMPPVEGLSADEVDAIIAYVREVQEREGFEEYPP